MQFIQWLIFTLLLLCAVAAAQSSCPQLVARPYRGISCLHCLHPNAPGGAAPIVEILKVTCLKRVAIAFVVDGSFGWDPSQIEDAINKLTSDGRSLWLHLYVYNGPAQRRWRSGVFHSFAVMDPDIFQYKLLKDQTLRGEFAQVVSQRIAPLVQFAKNRGAMVSIAPALEDNLNQVSFKQALALIKANLSTDAAPRFIRSPCYRCAGSSDSIIPKGVAMEQHTLSPRFIARNGIVHTDGEYFHFASDPAWSNKDPELSGLKTLMVDSGKRGNIFLLWMPKYQDAPPGYAPRSPDLREYQSPTPQERSEIINFLTQ